MGRDSSFLVYFDNPAIALADAENALARYAPARDGNGLAIAVPPGDSFIFIGLSDEPHVVIEAEDVAERKGKPGLATCKRRFECLIDDLEAALQDYTILEIVQEKLWRLTNGYVFLSWNGNILFEPE
jgi:hypothetical protein